MAALSSSATHSKLVFEKSSFENENSTHEKVIRTKHFTHNASVIMLYNGTTAKLPSEITEIEDQQLSYLVKGVPVYYFLDKEFIEGFIKKGQLYVLSHRTHIDAQNCVALLPSGHLILHVTKDTYEQLGLEGKPSRFSFCKPIKYVVDIDLKPEHFTPGRKGYDRIMWCLKDRLGLQFDFMVSWIPHDEKICPSSVSRYFENKGISFSAIPWYVQTLWLSNVKTPALNSSVTMATEESCGREELWEWLGALTCGIDMTDSASDNYLSTLSCPSPAVNCLRCCVINVTGFITPAVIVWLLNKIRCEVESKETTAQVHWGSLTLHGFDDTPVSVDLREHGFFQEGDNIHSFVLFPNKDYWLFSAFGHHDFCQ